MAEALANGASSTLNGAITNVATTLVIQTADIGKFPASGTYRLAVTDNTNTELMTVTGGQGTASLTVTRGSEVYAGASTAFAFASGSTVAQVLTNAGLAALAAGIVGQSFRTVLSSTATTIRVPASGSLPSTFTNLRMSVVCRCDVATNAVAVGIRLNGDTATNYDYQFWANNQAATGATYARDQTSAQIGQVLGSTSPSGAASAINLWLPEYSATTFWKSGTFLNIYRSTGANMEIDDGGITWHSTAAITSVLLLMPANLSNNFIAGSSATVYLET